MSKHSKNILNNWKLWVAVLAIVGLIAISVIAVYENKIENVSSNTSTKYAMIGKKINLTNKIKKEMYEKVKKDITDSLKTPSTAIFPKMNDWHIEVNYNNVIEVKSYVDSQNSYGAMLRANFEQQYIITNKNEYLCIYKEFNNDTEFDITEKTEYKRFINEEVFDFQMEDFIEKCKQSTIYGSLIDYNYNKNSQNLEINVLVKDLKNEYFAYESYAKGVIASYIDQCICIPTVTTKLNIKNEKDEIIATVNNINLEFLLNDWYTLWNMGIMNNTDGTNLEEKLKDKLWLSNEVK